MGRLKGGIETGSGFNIAGGIVSKIDPLSSSSDLFLLLNLNNRKVNIAKSIIKPRAINHRVAVPENNPSKEADPDKLVSGGLIKTLR